MQSSSSSRPQQLTQNASRPGRFKFLVGHKNKAHPIRSTSIRRDQSIRRAPSTRNSAKRDLKRRSGIASQSVRRPTGHLNWAQVRHFRPLVLEPDQISFISSHSSTNQTPLLSTTIISSYGTSCHLHFLHLHHRSTSPPPIHHPTYPLSWQL